MTRKLYIDGGINYDVENKAGVQILSNVRCLALHTSLLNRLVVIDEITSP